jgi:ATP-dependent DNA helicase RecQ
MRSADTILHEVFGFPGFRGVQAQVVDRVMAGGHSLAVMPTGAGKSLCYQLPALARPGTGLVISPLIALMEDQVRSAEALGIRAAALTSASEERAETVRRFRDGALDLLFVAPERASTGGFHSLLEGHPLSLIAIDEAHCVSEWGHDFRPDYRALRPLLDRFAQVPRLALTATADRVTRGDILNQLGIPEEGMVVAGFDRPNIRYLISPRDQLKRQLSDLLVAERGAGIIYAPTRDAVDRLAAGFQTIGRPVRAYHAGLDARVRTDNLRAFVASEDMVMVATVAFGMGIDKPDVRFVAHAALPKSIEAYYQETGRVGRDGEPAVAHLFWGGEDIARARRRIAEDMDGARLHAERQRLDALIGLVETTGCRRAPLLRHFGEPTPPPCGNCDNCLNPPATVDATDAARKLLSAVYRTGQRFGLGHLADVLGGRDSERVRSLGHDRLSVFGIAPEADAKGWRALARTLIVRDALAPDPDHGGLVLGPQARALLRGEARVELRPDPPRSARRRGGSGASTQGAPADDPLFEALRETRRRIARDNGVPPYLVFHDSTLRAMAALKPATLAQMGEVAGVGRAKLDAYGAQFLDAVRGFAE